MTCIVLQKYAATQKIPALSKLKLELLLMRLCCGTPRATAYGKRGNPGLRPAQANGPQSKDCSPQSRYARRYYAPLRLASQPHFWSGAARKFGKERTRVWGRPAQQAENRAAIPKKSDRWLIELARIRQLSAFSLPQTALCSHPYAKLAGIA